MPPRLNTALNTFREAGLVVRFALAGGAVMIAVMLGVGGWITARLEQSVVDNTAAAAALYIDSFISPVSQELVDNDTLSGPAQRALKEVFANTPIGDRIVSFKIWKQGGLIAYATNAGIIGEHFAPGPELQRAWAGQVSGTFATLDDAESAAEAALGLPLLEVYAPIRQVWSGEVIAVAEFYEVATDLEADMARARRDSWAVIAGAFVLSGALLFGIVSAGGRTIERQKGQLRAQIAEGRNLRRRAIDASARATAQTEKTLRRVSADLHDGPAQNIALATMRLDAILPDTETARTEARAIRSAMTSALAEIRALSRGLSLPDLEALSLSEVVRRALDAHRCHTGIDPQLTEDGPAPAFVADSVRICVYRFLQEGLSNAARHAGPVPVAVVVRTRPDEVSVILRDTGAGFDPAARKGPGPAGGQGLSGLRDRAESLGGCLQVSSAPGAGTTLILTLPLGEGDTP